MGRNTGNEETIMRTVYMGHSGFFVETQQLYYIFDYYEGVIPEMDDEKPLAVFVSHNHGDHYNPQIWDIEKTHENTVYLLSDDVPARKKMNVYSLGADVREEIRLGDVTLTVETFMSTDEGVAFYTECGGTELYHAGDLNVWAWYEEGMTYVNQQRSDFEKFTEKLRGRHVDAAFLLLDPRLEEGGFEGMDEYRKILDADRIFPMHQWGRYDFTDRYLKERDGAENIVHIRYEGQEFEI